MTSKQKYLEEIKEFETCEILITSCTDDLKEEIKNNCVWILYPDDFSALPSVDEFAEFLTRVKLNRKRQLSESNKNVDLIYYSWFDEQAGQLRFNIINSDHEKLPFRCSIVLVSDEREIISKFHSSFKEVTIPWNELTEMNEIEVDGHTEEYVLNVYSQKINR